MSPLCYDKHHELKELGQERGCLAYVSPLQSTEGSLGRHWNRNGNHGGALLTDLLSHDLFNLFFYTIQATSPGMPPPTVGWAFPYQSLTKKNVSTDLPIAQSGRGIFLNLGFPFPDGCSLCQVWKYLASTPTKQWIREVVRSKSVGTSLLSFSDNKLVALAVCLLCLVFLTRESVSQILIPWLWENEAGRGVPGHCGPCSRF